MLKNKKISARKQEEEELKKAKEDLEIQVWGLQRANEGIKLLYKELEQKTRKLKEFDQLKSDFVSTISHELRTPLTTMKEFTSIISDEIPGKLTKDQREYINIIKGNIDRLARLINNLLDMSKIEAGKIELIRTIVDVADLANSVVSTLRPEAEKKHIEFKTLFHTPLPGIYADADKIVQVFTNLIGNAIKFTPENGQITVEIIDRDKEVEYSVADTGVGIASENLDKLFGKFQQFDRTGGAGAKGTGLGLAITKKLLELHQGKIWVTSEPGKGSKFIFTLPKLDWGVIVKEHVADGIKYAVDKGAKFSIIFISVSNFEEVFKKLGRKQFDRMLRDLEKVVRKTLKRATDITIRDTGEIVVLLQEVKKEHAFSVKSRLEDNIKEYIYDKGDLLKGVQVNIGTATFPDEARDEKELIDEARRQLELLYIGLEQRKWKRKTIKVKVKISREAKAKEARLADAASRDLSGGGLGLFTKDRLKSGTNLFISMQIPSQKKPLEIEGKVMWSRSSDKDKEFPYRTGIKFIRPIKF